MFFKIGAHKNFANMTGKPQVLRPATLLKNTPAQVLSQEIREISKNVFIHSTPLVAASDSNYRKITAKIRHIAV